MDLVKKLEDEVSDNSVNLISQQTGESEEKTRAGIFAAIPAVLAGIMKSGAAGDSGLLSSLIPGRLTGDADITAGNYPDSDSLLEHGGSMMGTLFGEDLDSVANAVSDSSGISHQKSETLLAMAVPVIMGTITRMMSSSGWSFSDLIRKLFENKSAIASALPGNLSSTFGLAFLHPPETPHVTHTHLPPPGSHAHPEIPPVRNHVTPAKELDRPEPAGSGSGFLKWLFLLILLALVAWWLLGRQESRESLDKVGIGDSVNTSDTSLMDDTAAGSLNAAGDWIYDLGPTIDKKLPDGTVINIGENSVENRLISFIEDDSRQVDKTTWFSFDRLYFETGKSSLKPESKQQLENIVAIMKAYPQVKIKLGGYTDSTGDPAANKRLSTDRAVNAMKELNTLGVPADRMEAEGYGTEHPVAPNDTPEGRAQNRRIDVRVTAK
ncbi:OmpA family protein [Flavihumibacter sp. R14]|nr:OmpA family protein [Flavihumibacter soli]